MAARPQVAGETPAVVDGVIVAFLDPGDPGGVERQVPLAAAVEVAFEDARPVREFPSSQGQRNYPGLWWSATTGRHVGFESWLERDHAMLLDFDPEVVGFASQPFWLIWRAGRRGRVRRHAPDWFARRADGTGIVVDCRPLGRIGPRDATAFAAMAAACERVGWSYRLAGELDPVQAANVRWLAGYRRARHHNALVGPPGPPRPVGHRRHPNRPPSQPHRPAAGAAQPPAAQRPPRADRHRRGRHRQDHRDHPARPRP